LECWWESVKYDNPDVEELIIFADNGPENSGRRTQFLSRLIQFSEKSKLRIRNVYYPPYHSKYNPIERVWSSLERHWNGTLLSAANVVIAWTKTMTWKAMNPVVKLIDKIYEKGIKLSKLKKEEMEAKIIRNSELPNWDIIITITPNMVAF
ncbi:MAG: ISAzo13 family transposase, partial [Shewanella sp.]|nr:ISAzo13 family transposase [Shewanella sp.]